MFFMTQFSFRPYIAFQRDNYLYREQYKKKHEPVKNKAKRLRATMLEEQELYWEQILLQ